MAARSNFLIIVSDQHRRDALGAYGNEMLSTPNLDALANRGTTFTNAYCASPVCVPSRASLATGRYVHEHECWDNGAPYTGAEASSWGHRLTDQGYLVTTVGKLHYRSSSDPTGFPDQRLPMHMVKGVHQGVLRERMPPKVSSRQHVLEAGEGGSEYLHYDRTITRTTVEWLRSEAHRQDKPWTLFVSYTSPHFPLLAPKPYFARYDPGSLELPVGHHPDEWPTHPALRIHRRLNAMDLPIPDDAVRRAIAAYYGLVTFLDEQVGEVLNTLADTGLSESTTVLYCSDHGEMLGDYGLWWKSTMYEGAVAVPMILSGASVPDGVTCSTCVSLVDVFPTVIDVVGASLSDVDSTLPGKSLRAFCATRADQQRAVFSEYHDTYSPTAMFMLRKGSQKLVRYVGYPPQFFDLSSDPEERTDLSQDPRHSDHVTAMETTLRSLVDPVAVNASARAHQRRRVREFGGEQAIVDTAKHSFTPPPDVQREGDD